MKPPMKRNSVANSYIASNSGNFKGNFNQQNSIQNVNTSVNNSNLLANAPPMRNPNVLGNPLSSRKRMLPAYMPRTAALNPNQDKMAQIENIYHQANSDVMIYEVEIVDKKIETGIQISKAAERGVCVCRRPVFVAAGNIIIIILMALAIGATLIMNTPKDTTTQPLAINATCTIGTNDCDQSLDLKCPNGICVCNSNKYWNGATCSCPTDMYFDDYNCVKNKNYTETCSSNVPCLSYLVCNSSTCQCDYTKYFLNNQCVNKLPTNSNCTSYLQCQDYLGATCGTNAKCVCSSQYYWSGSSCVRKQFNGTTCSTNTVCDDTVYLYCTNSICQCNATYYWDPVAKSCFATKPYTETCNNDNECISSKSLICQTTANACNCPTLSMTGYCDCPTNRFWDSNTCALRNSINGSCIGAYACVSGLNLVCSFGFCVCTSPKPTWNGSQCV